MSLKKHYSNLVKFYYAAPINQDLKPNLVVKKGKSTLITTIQERHFHSGNAAHGSIIFKTLDDAAYFAAHSLVQSHFLVTMSLTCQFIKPVFAETITSIGHVIQHSNRFVVSEATSYNKNNDVVAHGTGRFCCSKILLSSLMDTI
ncbi:hypothetical protein DID76_04140 [Candidatus Marinamargulisbacteria bacterium SCGC AG-414-C22]|nr:hypothetical protein DID76_04140 [Candidatus Marinamargulisbacteria bacterium SCGC AG-414-C22]